MRIYWDWYNTEDWVESCTALLEDNSGNLAIIHRLEQSELLSATRYGTDTGFLKTA